MKRSLKRLVRNVPGFGALDNYLRRKYTREISGERHPRGHFYSPLPDLAEVEARASTLFRKDIDLDESVDLRTESQMSLLETLAPFYSDFDWQEQPSKARRFYLGQRMLAHGDAIILYAMMRHLRPKHVIEVGSGFSSGLMLDTDERFLGSSVDFTFIEPFPRTLLALLCSEDLRRCRVIRSKLQDVSVNLFSKLERNDILFVDSSHVSKIGSDVNFVFFCILPILKPGVVIHFHDVLWPFEYPREWILAGRAWNEAYLLRAFLQYNSRFEILLFNSYAGHKFSSFFEGHMPMFQINTGGSIWIRKRDDLKLNP